MKFCVITSKREAVLDGERQLLPVLHHSLKQEELQIKLYNNQKHKSHHSFNNPVPEERSLKFNVRILKECIRANILSYEL